MFHTPLKRPGSQPSAAPLVVEKPPLRSIEIHGWKITTCKRPILNSEEIQRAEAELELPMPEMIFGHNALTVEHAASGFQLAFNALDALRCVDKSKEAATRVQVAYADDWSKAHGTEAEDLQSIKPYDWTYSTDYRGTVTSEAFKFAPSTTHRIDYERLKQREPIHFFDQVVLFEDELADNGTAMLDVKVAMMPSGFFILQRFFMRVDGVLLRMHETRIYHAFDEATILREYTVREDRYAVVAAKIPQWKDPSALTDADWVSTVLPPPLEGEVEVITMMM
ncbi:TIP41-like family-domain-containing protein [Syncephalis pseudoplumigaleata]|uniref:TIP41-like family-domain-containing protein n=1 Tax=Syncephalis pseudoplumigaleata TaxID=1712513 RepID=A0A4P9Z5B1_9FUNG|nr:TIP41-like family-domain-containing protein [Syncephalis pseudoplumigaleata]|eukprot:RKP27736.1 TIP41-like family-domain-containing protein [Syncephalis pseudoplumigaleata]